MKALVTLAALVVAAESNKAAVVEKLDMDINNLKGLQSDIEADQAELIAEGDAKYTKGWDEAMLQNGQANSGDKLYSEAEMNAELEPLNAKIAEQAAELEVLKGQVASLTEQVNAYPQNLEAEKAAAVTAFKAQALEEYNKQQIEESKNEVSFADFLK